MSVILSSALTSSREAFLSASSSKQREKPASRCQHYSTSFPTGPGHRPVFYPLLTLCRSRHRTGLTPWKRQQPWLSNTSDRNLPLRERLLGLVWNKQHLGSPLRAGEYAGLRLSSPPFPVQRQHSSLWEHLRCFTDCNMTREVVYSMNYTVWL